jgi:hypothetical protein
MDGGSSRAIAMITTRTGRSHNHPSETDFNSPRPNNFIPFPALYCEATTSSVRRIGRCWDEEGWGGVGGVPAPGVCIVPLEIHEKACDELEDEVAARRRSTIGS